MLLPRRYFLAVPAGLFGSIWTKAIFRLGRFQFITFGKGRLQRVFWQDDGKPAVDGGQ